MNIFYLHPDPKTCAQMHNDKHVVKMILETAQMLCTAHRYLSPEEYCEKYSLFKTAFQYHPSTKWCMATSDNYIWLSNLFEWLHIEYYHRYGSRHNPPRWHSASRMIDALSHPPLQIPQGQFTEPPQCMPDEHKDPNTIKAYTKYYDFKFTIGWRKGGPCDGRKPRKKVLCSFT